MSLLPAAVTSASSSHLHWCHPRCLRPAHAHELEGKTQEELRIFCETGARGGSSTLLYLWSAMDHFSMNHSLRVKTPTTL